VLPAERMSCADLFANSVANLTFLPVLLNDTNVGTGTLAVKVLLV
jgi:hypothetical protein